MRGLLVDLGAHRGGDPLHGAGVEARQPEAQEVAAGEPAEDVLDGGQVPAVPERHDQRERHPTPRVLDECRHVAEQLERREIGPVEIVEDDH